MRSNIDLDDAQSKSLNILSKTSFKDFRDFSNETTEEIAHIKIDGITYVYGNTIALSYGDMQDSLSAKSMNAIKKDGDLENTEETDLRKPNYVRPQYLSMEYNSKPVILQRHVILFNFKTEEEDIEYMCSSGHLDSAHTFKIQLFLPKTLYGIQIPLSDVEFWNQCREKKLERLSLSLPSVQEAFSSGTNLVKDPAGYPHEVKIFKRKLENNLPSTPYFAIDKFVESQTKGATFHITVYRETKNLREETHPFARYEKELYNLFIINVEITEPKGKKTLVKGCSIRTRYMKPKKPILAMVHKSNFKSAV